MQRAYTFLEFDFDGISDMNSSVTAHLQEWTKAEWTLEHAVESQRVSPGPYGGGHAVLHCGFYWVREQ